MPTDQERIKKLEEQVDLILRHISGIRCMVMWALFKDVISSATARKFHRASELCVAGDEKGAALYREAVDEATAESAVVKAHQTGMIRQMASDMDDDEIKKMRESMSPVMAADLETVLGRKL